MEDKIYLNVVEYIREEIRQDRLRIGNKLPTEREMAALLGISRNSIREALRTLSSLGIIESRQGSGNYLSDDMTKFFTESFGLMALVNKISSLDISQMRRALEIQAFSQIIDTITPEQVTALRETLSLLAVADSKDKPRIDLLFHQQLIELSGNTLMTCTSQALAASFLSNVDYNLKLLPPEQKEITDAAHLQIADALSKRDMSSGIQAIHRHYDAIDANIHQQTAY